jgi:transcriptional regulator, LysR family
MNAVAVYRKDKPLTKALVELIALAEEYWSSFSEEESF